MLIMAAIFLNSFHAAFAAFPILRFKKINARLLAHTIMYFHSNARRHRHIYHCEYGKKYFFHEAKIIIKLKTST